MIVLRLKGMEMPESCGGCELPMDLCDKWKTRNWGAPRPSDCPLIEIPPHGDLIDRDAAAEKIWDDMKFPSNLANAQFYVNELREMPTVIPAEEGE